MRSQALKIALAAVITAIVVGGGVYLWQHPRQSAPAYKATTQPTSSTDSPMAWNTYKNDAYGYEIAYPKTSSVRQTQTDEKIHLVHEIEIDDSVNPQTIVHVSVYEGSSHWLQAKQNQFKMSFTETTKVVNGNSLTIFSGTLPSDVGNTFYPSINAFVKKGVYTYQLEILGAGEDITSAVVSAYLDSFKVTGVVQIGFIEGKLEGPPRGSALEGESSKESLKVCAEETTSKKEYCKTTVSGNYKIEVPSGSYHVFAVLLESGWENRKAYYSELVTCGLSATCTSHAPIAVNVQAGATVRDVDPYDWYAN